MKYKSIADFLKHSGMRERELAAAVGVRQPMINGIKHKKHRPSPELAVKLEAITGIPLRVLLGLDEASEDPTPVGEEQSTQHPEGPERTGFPPSAHYVNFEKPVLIIEKSEAPDVQHKDNPVFDLFIQDDLNRIGMRVDLDNLEMLCLDAQKMLIDVRKQLIELQRNKSNPPEGDGK